jgi:hypothetical protein
MDPPMLSMSTPLGPSRDTVSVVDSRERGVPAGDLELVTSMTQKFVEKHLKKLIFLCLLNNCSVAPTFHVPALL